MLSYGYTLLCHEAIGALEAAGLDPMVGFLHRHRWGRPALALDLMEEFRPTTGDVAVWRCISVRQVRPEQFTIEDPTSPTSRTGGSEPTMIVIVAYDITDDGRREDVAQLLSGYGPRVQLSVFECEVTSIDELRSLRAQLRERIDPLEDQVRVYPTTTQTFAERYIIGARTVEERSDYWIVR